MTKKVECDAVAVVYFWFLEPEKLFYQTWVSDDNGRFLSALELRCHPQANSTYSCWTGTALYRQGTAFEKREAVMRARAENALGVTLVSGEEVMRAGDYALVCALTQLAGLAMVQSREKLKEFEEADGETS